MDYSIIIYESLWLTKIRYIQDHKEEKKRKNFTVIEKKKKKIRVNNIPSPFKLSRKSFTDLWPYLWARGARIPVGRFPSLARQNEQLQIPLHTGQCQLGSLRASMASSPYLEVQFSKMYPIWYHNVHHQDWLKVKC